MPLALSLFPPAPSAQTRLVEILNADVVEVTSDSLGTVRTLTGDVRLRQDTTDLSSRRAVYYESRGEVVLDGRVRVVSGRDTLTAAQVTYDSGTKTARASGDVRVGDGESVLYAPLAVYDSRAERSAFQGGGRIEHRGAVLTSPSGTYSSARRVAEFDGPVSLEDSTGRLTAERGTYDARVQRADFVGAVRLRRPDAALDADSVVYFRRTERARAYGRVVLERVGDGGLGGGAPADSSRWSFLFGEALVFDGQAETASARGEPASDGRPGRDPLLVVLRADSTGRVDSTLARAPRIDASRLAVGGDTLEVVVAAGGARLWERRLSAVADSARFVRAPAGFDPAPGPGALDDAPTAAGDSAAAALEGEPLPPAAPEPEPDVAVLEVDPSLGVPEDAPPADSDPPAIVLEDGPPVLDTGPQPAQVDSVEGGPPPPSALDGGRPPPDGPVLEADPAGAGPGPGSDRIVLLGARRPSVWADGSQLTGDSLAATARDGAVESLDVWGQAFAARLDTTLGRLQQIAGGQMAGAFEGDELRRLDVWPNAQTLYFRATPDGLLGGADQVSADSIVFRFDGGDLREISGYRGVDGTTYGPADVPDALRLPGFAYDPGGAPTRPGLLGDGWEAGWLERYGPLPPAAEPAAPDLEESPPDVALEDDPAEPPAP